MIPLRLRLSNFLSYGEDLQPIDLEGIHVACLCGPNGHGKSALLDAITWALWGQARSNTADDLVRLGQTQMQVELDFRLDGQDFRVLRKRSKGKSGQSDLQFQTRQEDGQWRALTGQGVRDTQARIIQALRMDYDTFINSAFILQGRSDEFARKNPGDRKRILGEILSLGVYDELAEDARAQRAEAQTRRKSLELEIERMETERAREPELRAEVERLRAERERAALELETARAKLQAAAAEKTRLDEIRRRRDDLVRRLQAAEADLRTQQGLLAAARRRVEAAQALQGRADAIRARAEEYRALRREQEELAERLAELRRLEGARNTLGRKLQQAEHDLNMKLQLARQRVREMSALAQKLPEMERDLQDLERQIAALDRLQEERSVLQARLPELAGLRAEAAADQRRCAEELEQSDERFTILKSARAVCPTCEGALPDEKRLELGRKLRDDKQALKLRQGQAIQKEADAKREEAEVRRKLQELETKLRTGQAMRDRFAQVKQECQRIRTVTQTLEEELRATEELGARIQAGQFAEEERRELAAVEESIRALGYDESRGRALAKRLAELGTAERDLQSLEAAEAELPGALEQAAALAEAIRLREEAMAADREARLETERDLGALGGVEAQVRDLERVCREAQTAEASVTQRLGASEQALARCEALEGELKSRREARDAAARDEGCYEELAKAFGRNGIQALIIENALPEIEEEANAILARMSESQLAVRLVTQKELRSGGQAETLDIEISDGLGPRRYELYSGGEAFRVNFAIRVALSKVLARRAGARLETLVIDEGFGSQDQEGRQRMVEAIHAVQDDFARILVITHLEELKDAFPTRIEVSKGPAGSQVAIY